MNFAIYHPACRVSDDGQWRVRKLGHQRYEAQRLIDGHWHRFGRCVTYPISSQAVEACEQAAIHVEPQRSNRGKS